MKVPLGELLKDSRDWRDRNPTDLHWNGRSIPALGGHVNSDGASAEWPSPWPVEGVTLLPPNDPGLSEQRQARGPAPRNDNSYLWISSVLLGSGKKEKGARVFLAPMSVRDDRLSPRFPLPAFSLSSGDSVGEQPSPRPNARSWFCAAQTGPVPARARPPRRSSSWRR